MEEEKLKTTLMQNFFYFLLLAGAAALAFTFFFMEQQEFFSGIRQMSLGLCMLGLGEWINHPQHKPVEIEGKVHTFHSRFTGRKRNSSSFGNLLEIGGLILIFTGLADYI